MARHDGIEQYPLGQRRIAVAQRITNQQDVVIGVLTHDGPDTLSGLRDLHRQPWSEEVQEDMFDMFHRVFDDFDEVVGEQMWNFADFQTVSGILRAGGNKKGMFTRDRKPKSAAYRVRARWQAMKDQQGC